MMLAQAEKNDGTRTFVICLTADDIYALLKCQSMSIERGGPGAEGLPPGEFNLLICSAPTNEDMIDRFKGFMSHVEVRHV